MKVPAVWVGGPRDGSVDLIDDSVRHITLPVLSNDYFASPDASAVSAPEARMVVCPVREYKAGGFQARFIVHPDAESTHPGSAECERMERPGIPVEAQKEIERHDARACLLRAHEEAGYPKTCLHRLRTERNNPSHYGGLPVTVYHAECWPVAVDPTPLLKEAHDKGVKEGREQVLRELLQWADQSDDDDCWFAATHIRQAVKDIRREFQ